ncbi:MAG: hypothetical protein KDI51_17165, partial [Xanthomonadales bacterium]|nr:hypothetical protein [Xanthomonadales bacterium]
MFDSRFLARSLAIALLLTPCLGASYPLSLSHHVVSGYGFPVGGGMLAVDLSGDGVDEILFTSFGLSPLLAVFQGEGSDWRRRQLFLLPERDSRTQLHAWSLPNETRIVSVALHQTYPAPPFTIVDIYAGWPLAHQSSYTIDAEVIDSLVADTDGDGEAELLLLGGDSLRVLHPATGALLWSVSGTGTDMLVDQLDDDPAPEIVISGPFGKVIDGVTRTVEYEHTWSFGSRLASGRIGASGQR